MKEKLLYFFGLLFLIGFGCQKEPQPHTQSFKPTPKKRLKNEKTFPKDTTLKYEFRTGTSGNYQYNYDVSGSSESNQPVKGNLTMKDEIGEGFLILSKDTIKVNARWKGYGKIEATDNRGLTYQLSVN